MSASIWKPNATVALVVEHAGRYLLVEEHTDQGLRFNQPAGHLDPGESLLAACVREGYEETGYAIEPQALVGIYQWSPPAGGDLTYLRFAYAGRVDEAASVAPAGVTVERHDAADLPAGAARAHLDDGIVRAVWLDYDAVLACRERHRSPLVLQCIDDYRAGRRFPLDLVRHHD
ncbi:NUDIX hydrolase [Chitinimonas koreensis]|uniref:NUDIX hydrolase n=1 Tax=Chitinimonas koreensis TaxID=356302 RepID=UPI0003FE3FFD|nr:NUDIX hydrolase [Chitinimonas koreensis]QNM97231.1 NUDIX hydrolase [Chitinimonas koreensis]